MCLLRLFVLFENTLYIAGDEIDLVYNDLKKWTDMKVFKREEIPDFYHIKNATYALDLLILPNFNNVSLSTADSDHPYLYLPPLLGDDSDDSQAKGKGHCELNSKISFEY